MNASEPRGTIRGIPLGYWSGSLIALFQPGALRFLTLFATEG